jgi:hypothetical protein
VHLLLQNKANSSSWWLAQARAIEAISPFLKGVMGRAVIRLREDVSKATLLKTCGVSSNLIRWGSTDPKCSHGLLIVSALNSGQPGTTLSAITPCAAQQTLPSDLELHVSPLFWSRLPFHRFPIPRCHRLVTISWSGQVLLASF